MHAPGHPRVRLETVELDRLLVSNLLLDKEGPHCLPLVTLELQHLLLGLLVLEHRAVAAMLLLDGLEDLLEVELWVVSVRMMRQRGIG